MGPGCGTTIGLRHTRVHEVCGHDLIYMLTMKKLHAAEVDHIFGLFTEDLGVLWVVCTMTTEEVLMFLNMDWFCIGGGRPREYFLRWTHGTMVHLLEPVTPF